MGDDGGRVTDPPPTLEMGVHQECVGSLEWGGPDTPPNTLGGLAHNSRLDLRNSAIQDPLE